MAKQHERYRIYRAFLRLYPRQHREAYSEQMVQTLDDMLADQPTVHGRLVVWLRVGLELPFNIYEENSNSMGEITVNKLTKITSKQYLYGMLAILFIGGYVLMGALSKHQRDQITILNKQVETVNQNQHAMSGGNYRPVTIIPSEKSVYFPLANLKLPASTLNEELVYGYVDTMPGTNKKQPAQLSISTHDLARNNFATAQFDCSEVVYADFVTPSYPTNPHWKSNGNVKLADGRTMNIYYAPSIPGCDDAWQMSNIDSKAIADSLKEAVSY